MMVRPRFTPATGIRLIRPVAGARRGVSNTSNVPDTENARVTPDLSTGKPRAYPPFRSIFPGAPRDTSNVRKGKPEPRPPNSETKPAKKKSVEQQAIFFNRVGAKQLMENPRKIGDKLEIQIEPTGDIDLEMDPGTMKASLLWLRDVCPCPKCVDPHSGQKSFSLVDLPDHPQVRSAEKTEDGSLKVIWENDGVSGEDLHESIYPRHKLIEWTNNYFVRFPAKLSTLRKPWNQSSYASLLESGVTRISYKDWTTDREAFHRAFTALAETGLIFITDVPHGEQEVERIGNQIGMLQHTFYGTTWDVKSKPNAENVAYTSQFLGLHQDLMYHVPIPRLQLLHCLENSCEGGESLFSDGLHAALHLKTTNRKAFNLLNERRWFFGYDKAPHHYERVHPVISVDKAGYIQSIHWAPPFQTPFLRTPTWAEPSLESLKAAATLFEKALSSPENMLEVKLNPGEAIIFDNWRVLHGRREFAAGAGGSRWLKGAYITDQVFTAVDERRPRGPDDYPVWPLPNAVQFRAQAAKDEMGRFRALHGLPPA